MAFDEALAHRLRDALDDYPGIVEKKMFGGLAFMLQGNMSVGVIDDELMVRVGPEAYDAALGQPHARPMDFTGRPLTGFVYVAAAGIRTEEMLQRWVERGASFAQSLPPK